MIVSSAPFFGPLKRVIGEPTLIGACSGNLTTAVPKLVHGITRGLFRADIEKHWVAFQAYDVPQAVIRRETGGGDV